jgi:glyoxylase-like metal-dependent hydrolase (beta-lactamase superfamily II)
MKRLLIASFIFAAAGAAATAAHAESKLKVTVLTGSPAGFLVDSVLITGEKEAILIDGQFDQADAHRAVAAILDSGKKLTTVYVTHGHPDHYFGLGVIKAAFPSAKLLALPSTVKAIQASADGKVKQWKPMYGDNLTDAPIIPEALGANTLTIEGETLEITGDVQGDDKANSFVWIPSLKTVVAGDVVYNGVYPWTLETTPELRAEWVKTLDKIAALKPAVVIAGHKDPKKKDDLAAVDFTKKYLLFYDKTLAGAKSSDELQAKVKKQFPGLQLDIILKLAADAQVKPR